MKNKILNAFLILIVVLLPLYLSTYIDMTPLIGGLQNNVWGYIGLFILQFLQVIFIPINGMLLIVPAVVLFGNLQALIILWVSKVLGSIFVFYLGKKGGIKILSRLFGEEKTKKYIEKVHRNHILLISLLLFPVAPDDVVCFAAGASGFSYKFFIPTITLTRIIELFSLIYIGGELVKSTLGTITLVAVYIVAATIIYLTQRRKQNVRKI